MERRDQSRYRQMTRRVVMLAGLKGVAFSAIAGRLYYLQVIESDNYRVLSDDNRINMRLLAPLRGRILDRRGVELANNRRNYRVLLVAEQTDSVERTLARLGQILPIEDNVRYRVQREVERRRKFVPIMVAENLNWEDFARVNLYGPELPGIVLDVGETRDYPFGSVFSHPVGYVAAVSEQDLGEDPLLELPGFRIGKSGIERTYDERMRGRAGNARVEVNAFGRVIRDLARTEGQPGEDMSLTIDADLQLYAMERMKDESASAVVMNVRNGDVLCLASNPGFDPNWFNVGITGEQWRQLNNNKYKPLINKAIAGQYPPGSTYKMMVGLAALEAGVITPEQRVYCPGHMEFGNNTFHCWKKGGHGAVNYVSAIEESCDVYFYEVARRTGPDRIAEMVNRFGLGTPTGIDLPGERKGLVPTRDWKKATLGQPWSPGETLVVGIGQGYVLATPLQLCVMAARFANGGRMVAPRLVRPQGESADFDRVALEQAPSLNINPQHFAYAIEGMRGVTNSARGTAFRSRIQNINFAMAGKTGTSQVRRITQREREIQFRGGKVELPWEERHHALFVGFAPLHDPKYAVSIVVEHGGGGSTAAAPIARDLLQEIQRLDALPPGQRQSPGTSSASLDGHRHQPGGGCCSPERALAQLANWKPGGA